MFSLCSCFFVPFAFLHVSLPQGHVVFDASGSRMAWTLIEQLQGEQAYGMGEAGGQAGAGLGHCLGAEQRETSHDCLGASPSPALLF